MLLNTVVTGGAGYTGYVLTEHLLLTGYQVTIIENLAYGTRGLIHHLHCTRFKNE